jgi:hypothetical protein
MFAALAATAALVFAQFAVSAHGCPLPPTGSPGERVVHAAGCAHGVPDKPINANVCEQHCQYGHASVDGGQSAPITLDAWGAILRVEVSGIVKLATCSSLRSALAAAQPPPAILFGVLRI